MNNVTRALKNWQDYKEIRVSGDSKPTANAKKLIALFTKATGQGTFEIARVDCSNWYGRETGILVMYKTPEAYEDYKKLCKNRTVKELRNLFRDLVDIHLAILNIEEKDLFHADSYMDVSFCIDYPKPNTSIRDFMYYDFTDKYQEVTDEVIAKYYAFYLHTKEKADQALQNTDYEYSDNTLQAMSLHLYRYLLGY